MMNEKTVAIEDAIRNEALSSGCPQKYLAETVYTEFPTVDRKLVSEIRSDFIAEFGKNRFYKWGR